MADTRWFQDAKFGLFVHFGLYSNPAGVWRGKEMGRNRYAEWIRMQQYWPKAEAIPKAEYDTLLQQFNPTKFDADLICREAAAAGMRYFVLTTKHHDGFALWPSKISNYSVESTPCQRDLLGEFVAAGLRHGLKIGFYYSHWLDWEYPGGALPPWPERPEDPTFEQPSDDAFERYWTQKSLPQVAELIERYSPDLFWFDSWGPRTERQLTSFRLNQLIQLVRQKSPKTLINSRIGTEKGVDFFSTNDNEFPTHSVRPVWETSATMNHSWGYSSLDKDFRPTGELLRCLIDNISRGGNLQLNIGPRGDGSVEPAVLRRLRDLASWMSINGHAVHGTRPLEAEEPDWGRLVRKGNTIFAHVYRWPESLRLELPALPRIIKSARVVETDIDATIETNGHHQTIILNHRMPDDRLSIIELN